MGEKFIFSLSYLHKNGTYKQKKCLIEQFLVIKFREIETIILFELHKK